MRRACIVVLFWFVWWLGGAASSADCIDVSQAEDIKLSGRLQHRSFAVQTPPERASAVESAYLLALAAPACFFGDEFLGGEVTVSEVHLMIEAEEHPDLFVRLRDLIGANITAEGARAFGSHSRHHRAPVVLVLSGVSDVSTSLDEPKHAVESFYLALGQGDGVEAARHIIPAKRSRGPLSAAALSRFYSNLKQPLELRGIEHLGGNRFRAHYQFQTVAGARCDGTAVATTTAIGDEHFIARIVAERGC